MSQTPSQQEATTVWLTFKPINFQTSTISISPPSPPPHNLTCYTVSVPWRGLRHWPAPGRSRHLCGNGRTVSRPWRSDRHTLHRGEGVFLITSQVYFLTYSKHYFKRLYVNYCITSALFPGLRLRQTSLIPRPETTIPRPEATNSTSFIYRPEAENASAINVHPIAKGPANGKPSITSLIPGLRRTGGEPGNEATQ